MCWSLLGVLHLGQAKLINCNQIKYSPMSQVRIQWQIQDFPGGGPPTTEGVINLSFGIIVVENCMEILKKKWT